ncbi:protein kinase C, partial [Aureobasidium melanogenum]
QQPEARPPPAHRQYSSQSAAAAAAAALSGKRSSAAEQRIPPYNRSSTDYQKQQQQQQQQLLQQQQQQQQQQQSQQQSQRSSTSSSSTEQYPQQRNSQPQPAGYNPADYAAVSGFPVQPLQQPPQQAQPPRQQYPLASTQTPPPTTTPTAPPSKTATSMGPPARKTQGGNVRVGLDHFNFLAVLGKGNFGKVMLAETKQSKQLYAIKVLKKEFIIENDEVESTRSEKRVFLIANKERHPFLTNLHACFQTETRIYFVMEYISGGDLMLHIQRGQFGTKRAQFYAAEVCLALKYFHENGVIYRDLKLDNILLTLDGHIKIADYGLCKEDMWYGSTTSTFCGTPEFMAPEILLDKKYGRAVDWWAFGVLIYQMLLQQSPFRGEDEDEI